MRLSNNCAPRPQLDAQNASMWEQIGDAEKALNHATEAREAYATALEAAARKERSQTHSRQNGLLNGCRTAQDSGACAAPLRRPRSENLKFGGNTSCVEIRTAANECVIFDAGSGIRGLGQLSDAGSRRRADRAKIFLTHFHWDHIQGIPFFAPIYGAKNHITFLYRSRRDAAAGDAGRPDGEALFPDRFRPGRGASAISTDRQGGTVETDGADGSVRFR